MAKRAQDGGDDVSLFPFLSVLACVIGTLTMIIAAVAVQALDNDTVDQAMKYEEKKAELANADEELAQLNAELKKKETEIQKENSAEQKKLDDAKKRLAELLAKLEETQLKLDQISLDGPKVDLAGEAETLKEMEAELKSRREKIAQMEKEVADRKLPPKESEVSILPGGSGVGFDPSFIECDDGRIVIHEGDKTTPVRTNEMNTNPVLIKLLETVKANPKGQIVFLIRNDGLSTYYSARNLVNAKQVKNGKLPVVGDGRIDLSYFKEKKPE
ncbi:hypothetical protein LOC68_25075 [Blastopirellula sp. JC732]|uniref:IncA protein n=1 Tax=Blastopirellula sediminis TaxID=2894196 RepID=A0A9X1MQM0_9BACT|nr:hypothetical protein [Blastopirellula sediminis]MCC9605017.1 hypothetical protein [Blastopirellula sediminis]MCC9631683.1 hypothetical protein [Blastopirellula sediminis]